VTPSKRKRQAFDPKVFLANIGRGRLLSTERGLGSLCIGGFFDAKLNRFLGLDGVHEAAIYGISVGYPESTDPEGVSGSSPL
jgi:hypothetical protein